MHRDHGFRARRCAPSGAGVPRAILGASESTWLFGAAGGPWEFQEARESVMREVVVKRIAIVALAGLPALAIPEVMGDIKQFTGWLPAENLGPEINTPYVDSCVAVSKNGLSLYFSSSRQSPTDPTDRDLYVSQRPSIDDLWGAANSLTMLNSSVWDSCPQLSPDEHSLYFTTRRATSCGFEDIWMSRRQDRKDDFAWEQPTGLGCQEDGYINGAGRDFAETVFEDQAGHQVMYFSKTKEGGPPDLPGTDFYQSTMRDDGTFGPAVPIAELNSPYAEVGIAVRRDGLEVFLLSGRPHGDQPPSATYLDFWTATRTSTRDRWSRPAFVPALGNPALASGHIVLSFDGRELYFSSVRGGGLGGADLWVARRERFRLR